MTDASVGIEARGEFDGGVVGSRWHRFSLWRIAPNTKECSVSLMVVAQARHKKKPVKKTSRGSSSAPSVWERHTRDLWILLLVVIGAFFALAEAGALGPVGRGISKGLAVA